MSSIFSSFFGGKKGGTPVAGGGDGKGDGKPVPPARDPRKAARFFQHAKTVAESQQYDYAIECYINGLRHNPGDMDAHEALRDVAKRRKVSGGKPPSAMEKMPSMTMRPDPVEKMLHAEALWSKDPLNLQLMIDVMDKATAVEVKEPELQVHEFAFWIGNLILSQKETSSQMSKKDVLRVCELLEAIGAYPEAVNACKMAIILDPSDQNLHNYMKNLDAENTTKQIQDNAAQADGSFRGNVKNATLQNELQNEDQLTKSERVKDEIIAKARKEYDEKPEEVERAQKLAIALTAKDTDQYDEEAVRILTDAYKRSGQNRWKMQLGDIKIKMLTRKLRELRKKWDEAPADDAARKAFHEHGKKKLVFELDEFAERVKNYPTQLEYKFELAKRMFAAKKYVDAIGLFQQVTADPKTRATAQEYLGKCYIEQGWFDEAVSAFKDGIEAHPFNDDAIGMSLRYHLMDSLAVGAEQNRSLEMAQEAGTVCSQILRTNIGYKDIRERQEKIKKLIDTLKKEKNNPNQASGMMPNQASGMAPNQASGMAPAPAPPAPTPSTPPPPTTPE